MIQLYNEEPISAQRNYMAQIRRKKQVEVFSAYIRENKTIFGAAPQNGMPVVLSYYSNNTHLDVVAEIKDFVDEFISRTGI